MSCRKLAERKWWIVLFGFARFSGEHFYEFFEKFFCEFFVESFCLFLVNVYEIMDNFLLKFASIIFSRRIMTLSPKKIVYMNFHVKTRVMSNVWKGWNLLSWSCTRIENNLLFSKRSDSKKILLITMSNKCLFDCLKM